MTAVSLSRVTKVFPGRGRWNLFAPSAPAVPALGEISLEVPEGEIVGLLGRNGAGKTTLLRILAGYLYADSGEVSVLGRRLPEEESALKGQVIYVGPEERSFFFRLSVRQNLDLFLRLHGLRDREAAMGPWLDHFEMRPYMHRRFDSLSTGQRQKIALVRAFSTGARLILFDEPFRSLDDEGIEKLGAALERLAGPVTFLIASPQEHPLLKRCSRVVKIG
jgi:ABC-type multidrug transport system ATPase subunit